jgi:hypothetical protein
MVLSDTSKLAQILAIQAEIDGMKAENQVALLSIHGASVTYGEGFFQEKARELRELVDPEPEIDLIPNNKLVLYICNKHGSKPNCEHCFHGSPHVPLSDYDCTQPEPCDGRKGSVCSCQKTEE